MKPNQTKRKGGARLAKEGKPPRQGSHLAAGSGSGAKPPKQKRTPKQQALFVAYIIVMVLAGLIVTAAIVVAIFVKKPDQVVQPSRKPVIVSQDPTASPTPGQTPGQTEFVSSDRKDGFYTFLLVGRDTYGGGNTDTMMLAAYDVPNQKVSVMSIPRDTMVNVSWDIKRINSVYNVYGGGDDGMDALKEEIAQLVGFQPDYTFVVEWEAVGTLVDAVGGVYFEVPRRMYYNDLSQHFKIDIQAGYQLINGSKAMGLLRWRHNSDDSGNILDSGYADGDLGRIRTQQAFLKAVIEQCLKNITSFDTIKGLAQVFFDNVTTELSVGNLAWFAQQAILGSEYNGQRLNMSNVSFVTMPNTGKYVPTRTSGTQSYVVPNVDELVDVVNEHFNPYKDDLRQDELDIMYVNKDGTLGCTGGVLEDTRYNSWVVNRPVSTPKPSASPSAEPSDSPEPTEDPTAEPTDSPEPTESPTASPEPSGPPEGLPSVPPEPTVSPEPSEAPSPEPTPEPSPSTGESEPPASGTGDEPPAGIPVYD